jgi:cystathionine gamma-synthase
MSGGCRPATRAVRAGIDRDSAFGAVTPPLVLSSNFSFAGFNDKRRYDYTRSGNPTRDLLGEALAELEGGAGGVVTATGMAAITLVLNALLEPGDRLVVPHDGYGGSWRLFNALANKGAFELITADLTDPRPLTEALASDPTGVWIETPSNPLLKVSDIRSVASAATRGSLGNTAKELTYGHSYARRRSPCLSSYARIMSGPMLPDTMSPTFSSWARPPCREPNLRSTK